MILFIGNQSYFVYLFVIFFGVFYFLGMFFLVNFFFMGFILVVYFSLFVGSDLFYNLLWDVLIRLIEQQNRF